MGRIAVTEDVEGIRDEELVVDKQTETSGDEEETNGEMPTDTLVSQPSSGKFIATVIEVQDAFDSLNTLRYSQPTHLQGGS